MPVNKSTFGPDWFDSLALSKGKQRMGKHHQLDSAFSQMPFFKTLTNIKDTLSQNWGILVSVWCLCTCRQGQQICCSYFNWNSQEFWSALWNLHLSQHTNRRHVCSVSLKFDWSKLLTQIFGGSKPSDTDYPNIQWYWNEDHRLNSS